MNLVLHEALKDGRWVCLQNCDVADAKWFAQFDSLLDAKELHDVNLNFRIFMTFASNAKMVAMLVFICIIRKCT